MIKAIVFPGQGSQIVGMAKDLYESHSETRDLFKKANDILNYDLGEICFNGPQEKLNLSNFAQLGIFVSSIAFFNVLNAQQKAMESFYKGSAIDMGELAKAAGKAAASASSPGIGNSTKVNMSMEKNVAVDNALGITNKQISNISDETENTMMSTIKNNNNVDISNAINVENKIRLANISACDNLTIDNLNL